VKNPKDFLHRGLSAQQAVDEIVQLSALAFPKPFRLELPHYLAFVRGHPCVVKKCWKKAQASHVVFDGQGKAASKVSDTQTVPKCDGHHKEYGRIGRDPFAEKYGLDFAQIIISLLTEYVVLQNERLKARRGQ